MGVLKAIWSTGSLCVLLFVAWLAYIHFRDRGFDDTGYWTDGVVNTTGLKWEFVKVNNVTLDVITCGDRNQPMIVFLHGFPQTALLSWHYQLGYFCDKGYFVVAPDQRGYNKSSKPAHIADYRPALLSQDLTALIKHYKHKNAKVVGHDWGAVVAWRVAIFYPEYVDKLVIINVPHPAAFFRYMSQDPYQLLRSWYMFYFQIPVLPELAVTGDNYIGLRKSLANFFGKGVVTKDEINRYIQAWSEPNAMTGMINWYRTLFLYRETFEHLPKVKPPTRIIWGKHDLALGYGSAELSVKECEKGELFPLDCNHFAPNERPQEVNRLISQFFDQ